jgi:uncharacterized protein YlzI (FlbEa/FlbD family)
MLMLSKLDKTRVLVPLETVKYIEETPDTLIRFLNGESIIVREGLDEIRESVTRMRRLLLENQRNTDSQTSTLNQQGLTPQ